MKILVTAFTILFLCVHAPIAYAGEVEDEFNLQLQAIVNYLERQLLVSSQPLSQEEMRVIIKDSAEWFIAAQEDSGHFGYEYLPYKDIYREDDNMVRQGGTLYALSEIYKHQSTKDPRVAQTIEQAISYFESISDARDQDTEAFVCIKNSRSSTSCDLGSTALALIGVLNYVAAEPTKETVYAEIINTYATYIQTAKFENRGFSNKYSIISGFSENESPFYNGEAMLALVRYYQYKEDPETKTILRDSFTYLASKEEYETPLYLWIMAALKDMQKLWPDDAYVRYARDFTTWRLDQLQYKHNYCAPVEGLASAYSILEGHETDSYLHRLTTELQFWLHKTTRLQIGDSDIYRVLKDDKGLSMQKMPNLALAKGGFLTGEDELTQRIDFTQHCANTYLQQLVDIDGGYL